MQNHPKFYNMFFAGESGVAYPSADAGRIRIPYSGTIQPWKPLELTVRPGEWGGPFADYMNSNLDIRLCSRRLKDLLESMRSKDDTVQWLESYITGLDGTRLDYHILHFPEAPDVLNLDPNKSLFNENGLLRPCISREKAAKHNLFNIPGLENATVVQEGVKRAIEESGMDGMEFTTILTR